MRVFLLMTAFILCSATAMAQTYDSGWKIVAADALSDLEFTGGGMRLNNFVVTQQAAPKSGSKIASYELTATALKRTTGQRSARIELIGFKEDKTPSICSIVAINIYDENANKVASGEHRFLALPSEVAATTTYLIRVMIP